MVTLCVGGAKILLLHPLNIGFHFSCSAFPDEVPDSIYDGEFDHREPYPGDNGIRFELAPFEVLKDRWIFQTSSQPYELANEIDNIFAVFDVYRAKGSLDPLMNQKTDNIPE